MHGEHESLGVELRVLWEVLGRFELPGLDVDAFRESVCKMAADRTRRERRYGWNALHGHRYEVLKRGVDALLLKQGGQCQIPLTKCIIK